MGGSTTGQGSIGSGGRTGAQPGSSTNSEASSKKRRDMAPIIVPKPLDRRREGG